VCPIVGLAGASTAASSARAMTIGGGASVARIPFVEERHRCVTRLRPSSTQFCRELPLRVLVAVARATRLCRFEDEYARVGEARQRALDARAHVLPLQTAESTAQRRDGHGLHNALLENPSEVIQSGFDVGERGLCSPVALGREIDDQPRRRSCHGGELVEQACRALRHEGLLNEELDALAHFAVERAS